MIKTIVISSILLLLVATLAVSLDFSSPADPGSPSIQTADLSFLERKIVELESQLQHQQTSNEQLARRVSVLEEELQLAQSSVETLAVRAENILAEASIDTGMGGAPAGFDREAVARQRAVDSLVERGFDEFRAQGVLEEVERVRTSVLSSLDPADGRPDPDQVRLAVGEQLRISLGEYDYEQYLEATDQPTRVPVRDIEPDSPAAAAGLQPGDNIVRYAGERVFNSTELIAKTGEMVEGSNVVIEVERDGVPYSFTVPAGTLGVSIDRRR